MKNAELVYSRSTAWPLSLWVAMTSKGELDDVELAGLTEEQLKELAEFIDPDVSEMDSWLCMMEIYMYIVTVLFV